MAAPKKKVSRRRREKKNIEKGQAHIRSSFNNTIVTMTDMQGNALSQSRDVYKRQTGYDYSLLKGHIHSP